jgi:hypothetical protein
MWAIFKLNVLTAMVTGQFKNDPDAFAEFYANEYDKVIKSGGDLLYGVNVINGNVQGMANAIKAAFKKGTDSVGENYNVLSELYPACFDAYWMGAEMSPLPNPLVKPLGWQSTPPAPGTIQNIGPDPISLAATTAAHKAEIEALKVIEDELKKQTITIPIPNNTVLPEVTIPLYETALKIINKKSSTPVDSESQQFFDKLKNYFTRPNASITDKAKWLAFQQLNEEYGYANVSVRNRTIVGKRSITNPFTSRLNLVPSDNPSSGEYKSIEERLMDEYMVEYGHYIQFNQNPDSSKLAKSAKFLGGLAGDYGNMIKNATGLNLTKAYTENYTTPGTTEYEAHQVIEKKIRTEFDENVKKYIVSNITELRTGVSDGELDDIIRNNPIVKNAIDVIKKIKEAKKKKPSIGKQIKKALKFEFPKLPSRKKIIEEAKEKLLEKAIEEIKNQIIPPIEDIILAPIYQYVQMVVALMDSIPNPKPTLPQIKKFVKDTINGLKPEINIPIEIPNLPKKEDFEAELKLKTPTEEQIKAMAEDKIKGLIPKPPFINIIPPTFTWSTKTNIMIDPFVSLAQIHLLGVSGNMMVMAQYPPPAPPAPAIINYTGYQVQTGPPVPDFPTTVKFPEVDMGSIELPKLPELPELPTLSNTDIASSLKVSLPNIEVKTPTIPKVG